MSKRTKSRVLFIAVEVLLLTAAAFIGYGLINPDKVLASPALSMSVDCGGVLFGRNATCNVSVTNTGADRGYGLSFSGVFSSSLTDPDGQVMVVDNPTYPYSSHTVDPVTGDTTVEWVDIRDLAAGEDFSFSIEVDLDETTGWEVGEQLTANIDATIFESPALVTPVTGSASDTADVTPNLLSKSFNQSTGQQQATGIVNAFSYSLTTTNNLINPTEIPQLRDTLPDGLEFVPENDPATACSVAPTTAIQNPDESWDLSWDNFDGNGDGCLKPAKR